MSDRMTDERLAEIENTEEIGLDDIPNIFEELLQALKAERERISELEAAIERIRKLPRYTPQVHWRSREWSGMRTEEIAGHELLHYEGMWIRAAELEKELNDE